MAALTVGVTRSGTTGDRGLRGPSPARTTGPAAADRSPATTRPGRTVRSWPLLVLAAPAAAEVWSGWVGIAEKTGFGRVSPLPGIWPSLHLDTTITLPIGVEAYAAYALRAWLSSEDAVSPRTRRFAKWSAICSFLLGMAGQVAHMLRADASATDRSGTADDAPDHGTGGPASPWSVRWSLTDQAADPQAPAPPEERTARSPRRDRGDAASPDTAPAARTARNTCPE